MNLRRFLRAYLLGIKTSNDRPYSKAVFSGFTRSFKKNPRRKFKHISTELKNIIFS